MSPRRWGKFLTLWLCLFAFTARAQSVTVLAFSGDKSARLRSQVYAAIYRAHRAKLVPIQRYKAVAIQEGFTGPRIMTEEALVVVAPKLKIDAVVEGTLEDSFFVRILDAGGNELWAKDLPLRRGLISPLNARRLAAAVYTAAKIAAKANAARQAAEPPPSAAVEPEPPAAAPAPPAPPTSELAPSPVESPPEPAPPPRPPDKLPPLPKVAVPEPPKNETPKQRAKRQRNEMSEAHTETEAGPDSEEERARKKADASYGELKPGPRLITVQLAGLTTWRSYCARPGVASCGAYDALPAAQQPPGERVDFKADVPYLGVGGAGELFPFARSQSFIRGLGLGGSYSRGFSLTKVRVETGGQASADEEVVSVDQAYSIYLAPRWFFARKKGSKAPLVGYAGGRLGLSGRAFEVDPSAAVPLPGSHRSYPVLGVDGSFPFMKQLRAEASASYFLSPKAGAEERALYGAEVSSNGFGLEAGVAGDLWGPFGYVLRLRYSVFNDRFSGGGSKWVGVDSGAARETYVTFNWGLTAHY